MAPSAFPFPDPPTSPPALASLLTLNTPPLGVEFSLATSHIEELEAQIVLLDEAMSFITGRRADLVRSLRRHKAIVSPIRHLPPEILGEIFFFAVRNMFHFGDISEVLGPMSHHAPWVLTRICRHWTAVALASPALWSMLFLDLDRVGERGSVPLTQLWLERSGNIPLIVKIFNENPGINSHLVLDAVMSYSERWKTADIYIEFPLLFRLAATEGRLSSLTTLDISGDITLDGVFVDAGFGDTLAAAPRLTSLRALFWDTDHIRRAPFKFPWHQLTRLCTTFTFNTEVLSLLQTLSNIVECRLGYATTLLLPADAPVTTLPHLRILELQIESGDVHAKMTHQHTVLNYLRTPRLERLSTYYTADPDAIFALLARSGCAASLTTFRFHGAAVHADALECFACGMPRLDELEVGDFEGGIGPGFVKAFAAQWRAAQEQYDELEAPRRGLDAPRPRQVLYARLVDGMYEKPDPDSGRGALVEEMCKDGLFVEVSSCSHYSSIIAADF
ncbi:hypothetical protein C8R44DRAFT_774355 [Mycena epipterygia]|nr:hypothetical protein C8R44DRAFT_774355 [Mycena epipterygia]